MVDWLNYPQVENGDISLLPSLARKAKDDASFLNRKGAVLSSGIIHWEKAFFLWILLNNLDLFSRTPDFEERIYEALKTPDFTVYSKLLFDIQYDPQICDEADDLRQWYYSNYRHSVLPLILQHYGMLTSTLDVTTNVKNALFFATNTHNKELNQYEKYTGENDPVIYLFIRFKPDTSYIKSSREIFERLEEFKVDTPERILRQDCGLLYSANYLGWNLYADLIVGKFVLKNFSCKFNKTFASELFPPDDVGDLYKILTLCQPSLRFLIKYATL